MYKIKILMFLAMLTVLAGCGGLRYFMKTTIDYSLVSNDIFVSTTIISTNN